MFLVVTTRNYAVPVFGHPETFWKRSRDEKKLLTSGTVKLPHRQQINKQFIMRQLMY
jgi:hypothetical protein